MAFIPVRGFAAPGRYPHSEAALRHIERSGNFSAAFRRANGRVLVDLDRLQALIAESGAVRQPVTTRSRRSSARA